VRVVGLTHPERRHAQAEKARIDTGEIGLDRREVEEILMDDLGKFRILLSRCVAPHRDYSFDILIKQAFAQHTLPDHSRCAKNKHFHDFPGQDAPDNFTDTSHSLAATAVSFAWG